MHPYLPELKELYRQRRVGRRQFVYLGSLLGMSMSAMASFMAACAQQPATAPSVSSPAVPTRPAAPVPTPAATTAPQPTVAAAATTSAPVATPTTAPAAAAQPTAVAGPKRGGLLNIGLRIGRTDNPWSAGFGYPWVFAQTSEYLTITDHKNVTHPWLLEKWEPSEDLKTWTLTLRQGIAWNKAAGFSGRELDADDVVFSLKSWLDPAVGSSAAGLMGGYLDGTGVEKVDRYTVRLHLKRGEVGVPEHLFHWSSVILPREWDGDWIKQPWGTGPFLLEEYVVGERVRMKRRDDYWQMGADGRPLPYLDELRYVDYGEETATLIASMAAGQIDLTDAANITIIPAMRMLRDFEIHRAQTSNTNVFRFRADEEPWNDVRVRNALKWSQDRERTLRTAFGDYGVIASDTHVAPVHPEYVEIPGMPWKQDIDRAKALLGEAGYPNGIEVDLTYKTDPQFEGVMCTVLQQEAAKAGIRVNLKPVPTPQYWDQWTVLNFGLTSWGDRPLASMVHALAYTCGAAWNESHWCDAEYESLLSQASAVYDIEQRRAIFATLIKHIQENGAIHIPFWRDTFRVGRSQLKDVSPGPANSLFLWNVWWDR